jgi:hypothetical protein
MIWFLFTWAQSYFRSVNSLPELFQTPNAEMIFHFFEQPSLTSRQLLCRFTYLQDVWPDVCPDLHSIVILSTSRPILISRRLARRLARRRDIKIGLDIDNITIDGRQLTFHTGHNHHGSTTTTETEELRTLISQYYPSVGRRLARRSVGA